MLSVKDLTITLEDQTIVHGFHLSVKPGEVHVIMGPNGSGKSTLAHTLAGHPHYQVSSGSIKLNRHELVDTPPNERAVAGLFLAFQYPVAIEGISVQNFLRTAHHEHFPQDTTTVLEFRHHLQQVARTLGIKDSLLKRSLNDGFSGGEKKRVEILQMLTLQPKYAIFDETDSGLDIDSIKLAAKGINQAVTDFRTGVIIITHYQRILKYVKPTHVHVMISGHLVKSGGPNLAKELEKSGYKNLTN